MNSQYSSEVCSEPQMACAIANQALDVGLGGPAADLAFCCATQSFPPNCLGGPNAGAVMSSFMYS